MLKVANSVINASQIATPITLSGDVTLSTGNLVIGTSGKGIDFSATTSGSGTMTSELLADYEEGTWTPVLAFGGASVGITYIAGYQNGLYTKVGNTVTLTGVIYVFSKGTSVGNATLEGIPFNSANTDGAQSSTSPRVDTVSFVNILNINASKNTSSLAFSQTTNAGVTTLMTNTNFADFSYVQFFITYRTA
jgi:hypothetical protein